MTSPAGLFRSAIYEERHGSILAYENGALVELKSGPAETWQELAVTDEVWNPQTQIYDGDREHMLLLDIYGGIWEMPLDSAPSFIRVTAEGPPFDGTTHSVVVLDPKARRLVGYEHPWDDVTREGGLWSLSLVDRPRWTEIVASGSPPGELSGASAVYDSAHDRMVVVNYTNGAAHVYALDLKGDPAWHEFCVPGLTPAWDVTYAADARVVLVPDGLFLNVKGDAFRFGLETPYCEEPRSQ